ncbi:MAG TPA: mechanosensitive ion channel family protein [Flavisolibacter sp.]|nr:mechanosensitive ion channel family protein [Flavisolibacter sp.]
MDFQKLYDRAYNWILTFGPRIIIAIIILFVGLWLIKVFKKWLFNFLKRRHIDPSICSFLRGLVSIVLQVLLLLGLMQILGIQMTIFAAVIGAFGVAAGLALSGTLQNFASGVLILLLKPYRVGDNISTQGHEGTVTSIQLFYTVILTFDNKTVIVPNSKLSNEVILNLSRQGTRRLDIELKFSYGYDFEQLKQIINKSVEDFGKINKEPEHRIGVSKLESDGFNIMINVWINAHGFEDTKYSFQQILVADLKKSGVKMPGT